MYHSPIVTDEGYAGINPVLFGYENCSKSHFYGPAVRTHWLIHFVVSGFGDFHIGGHDYRIGPGEMFVIPPYAETFYKADSEKPWEYIWVGFTASEDLPAKLPDVILCPEALRVFSDMKNCERLSTGRSAFLCARIWELFSLLLQNEKAPADYIETALDCIHSEYMNKLTVADIARRLNLDRTYFSTQFKKRVGVSPKKYLLDYRMGIAAALMIENGQNVSVAAYSTGYTDVFVFSKMFKRHYGISPTEYKKNAERKRMKSED